MVELRESFVERLSSLVTVRCQKHSLAHSDVLPAELQLSRAECFSSLTSLCARIIIHFQVELCFEQVFCSRDCEKELRKAATAVARVSLSPKSASHCFLLQWTCHCRQMRIEQYIESLLYHQQTFMDHSFYFRAPDELVELQESFVERLSSLVTVRCHCVLRVPTRCRRRKSNDPQHQSVKKTLL